jgi:hypothetical protein
MREEIFNDILELAIYQADIVAGLIKAVNKLYIILNSMLMYYTFYIY